VAKVFAYLTGGYLSYERGDHLLGKNQFMHVFSSEAELRSEFEAGGFNILRFVGDSNGFLSGAVLGKS
jgi:hypothetical protein